jgi:hypothetical protein
VAPARAKRMPMASLRPRSAARSRQVSSQVVGEEVRPGPSLGPGMREGVGVLTELQCRPEG